MTTTSDANGSTVDGFESAVATVAFVDLAGFSAIADVYGDVSAIAVLGCFEELVRQALGELGAPIKWIGDEAMFGFPEPATALQVLGRLLLSKGEKGEKGLREGAERVRQRALCSRRDGPNVSYRRAVLHWRRGVAQRGRHPLLLVAGALPQVLRGRAIGRVTPACASRIGA